MNYERSVSAISVVHLAAQLQARGVIDESWLAEQQPETLSALADWSSSSTRATLAETRLPEAYLLGLWAQADRAGIESLGLEIGQDIDRKAMGLLASWIASSETLEEAFKRFIEHIALLNASESWQITKESEQVICTFSFDARTEYPQIAAERSISAALAWAEMVTGRAFPLLSCSLKRSAPESEAAFYQVLGQHIEFDAKENSICFDRSYLALPLVTSNAMADGALAIKVNDLMSALRDAPLIAHIKQLLDQDIDLYRHAERVAGHFGMSRSTLFRRLKACGRTFHSVLEEVREERFRSLQTQKLPASEISARLGYAEVSAYYKARKNWSK